MALTCCSGVPQCKQVTRLPLATIALLCKDVNKPSITSGIRPAPLCHLSGDHVLFVPHSIKNRGSTQNLMQICAAVDRCQKKNKWQ